MRNIKETPKERNKERKEEIRKIMYTEGKTEKK